MNYELSLPGADTKLRNLRQASPFLAQRPSLHAPELQMPDILLFEHKDSFRSLMRLTLENVGYS